MHVQPAQRDRCIMMPVPRFAARRGIGGYRGAGSAGSGRLQARSGRSPAGGSPVASRSAAHSPPGELTAR